MCVYFGLLECLHVEEENFEGVRKYYDKEEARVSEKGSNRDWRKLYIETLVNLFSSPNIIGILNQKNEKDGSRSRYGREEKCILGLVKKPEEKRQLGINRLKRGDITTLDLT